MTFLLDVNVLIALIDPAHVGHDAAHLWFEREGRKDWASCPITQNGVVRIVGHPRYPNTPGSPAEAAEIVGKLCLLEGHSFWPDDISLFGDSPIDRSEEHTSELQSLMRISYAVFCLQKKKRIVQKIYSITHKKQY